MTSLKDFDPLGLQVLLVDQDLVPIPRVYSRADGNLFWLFLAAQQEEAACVRLCS